MKAVHLSLGTSLFVAATVVGVYAAAATAASTLAASFTNAETTAHARNLEFATRLDRASTERRSTRADQDGGKRQ